MANEKVYVGEDGAKELYRKIKALILGAVTVVDEVTLNSMDAVTSHAVALAIGNLTGFQPVAGIGADNHPNVVEPNTRTIYLVKIPDIPGEDKYKEWIWIEPSQSEGNWECIGSTTMVENAWKQWSEDHGSTSSNDNSDKSIYIGRNNTINAHSAVAIGKLNTISNSSGHGTHIYGNNNTVSNGHDSIVVGHDNTSSASLQVEIFGQNNSIDQTKTGTQYSAILGFNNKANDFDRSVMLGVAAKATEALYSTVIGNGAELYNCTYGTVVGGANIVKNGSYNSVFGSGNQVNVENTGGYRVSAIGNNLTISGTETHVMGSYSTVTGYRVHAIVTNSTINADNSNVIGTQISMYADSSGNVGYNNYVFGAMDTIYGGAQNVIVGCTSSIRDKRSNTVIVGENSTVENKSGDITNYSNTNIISIGYSNNAKSAANAYQIGRDNSVTDNNLASINTYPYQTAINLGVHNTITSEGVNLGKDNTSERFGVSIGQSNSSVGGSVAIGQETVAGLDTGREGAFAFGSRTEAYAGSMSLGIASSTGCITAGRASSYDGGYFSGGSLVLGIGELHVTSGSFGIGLSPAVAPASQSANQVLPANVSNSSFGIICDNITCDTSSDHRSRIDGNSMGIGSRNTVNQASIGIGYEVQSSKSSLAIGRQLTNIIDDAIVFGKLNNNIGSRDSAFSIANKDYTSAQGKAIALGYSNSFIHNESFAVGFNNSSIIEKSAVFGNGINNIRCESIALGFSCGNIYDDAIAIGHSNIDVSNTSIAIGKSNYSIGMNSIAIGHGNVNTKNASIAMGLSTSAENGSIVMGIGNHAIGGAIVFGIGNYSYENLSAMPKFTTNAFIAGLGNTAHSVRERWQNADFTSGVNPFGCIIGSYISSYGHNAISIGSFNIVGDREKWETDTTLLTDNDGFMTAIGYRCEALRNYDFAFGYKSVAKGGENVAIQHSRAVGYRNVALVDSDINGVANFGILESYLDSSVSNTSNKRVHNILAKSRVQCNDTPFYDNIVIGSIMTAPTTAGDLYPTSANIIIDNSEITGKAYTIQHNILFNQSKITSTKSTTGFESSTIFDNIAFNESTLEYRDLASAWTGTQQPLGHNISFGSYMGNTYGCVSIADRQRSDASLFNSLRVFNFGDNSISYTGESYCFGQSNTISWASRAFVCGHGNTFNGNATSLGDANNVIRHFTVFGDDNESFISLGSKIDRVFIHGSKNNVSTNIFDSRIFGNNNQLGWHFSEDTSTHETVTFAELKARQVQHPTVFITADEPVFVMGISGDVYSSQSGKLPIINNEVYIYCKGAVRHLYISDYSGQTVVSISGDDFIRGIINRTLTDWGYYQVTSSPAIQYSINELGRLWSSGAKVMKYPDGTIYSVIDGTEYHCNARDTIFGSNNTIQPAINDTTIFGSDNMATNPLQYPTSNSFIQGNNNVITNGSNIFVAGNGCVGNGHGAVAIGCQVKANHWQTVIGKYNEWVPGPDRLTPGEDDSRAALFVIGNGYSETDGPDWQNEDYIHRSNALELYADGRLKISGAVEASNIPQAPLSNGHYALTCDVVNGEATYRWVAIGTTNS